MAMMCAASSVRVNNLSGARLEIENRPGLAYKNAMASSKELGLDVSSDLKSTLARNSLRYNLAGWVSKLQINRRGVWLWIQLSLTVTG